MLLRSFFAAVLVLACAGVGRAEIEGPDSAVPGDLVQLSAETAGCDHVLWTVYPAAFADGAPAYKVSPDAACVQLATRPGIYRVQRITSSAAGIAVDHKIVIVVEQGPFPPGPAPQPKPPQPNPAPNPGPGPEPVPPQPNPGFGLQAEVSAWAATVNTPSKTAEAAAIVAAMLKAATAFETANLLQLQGILDSLAIDITAATGADLVAWQTGVLKPLEQRLGALYAAKKITNGKGFAQALREAAAGLTGR